MMTRSASVLIKTLPLNQGNYGGVLQAYALQQVLRQLGCDPVTDSPTELPSNIGGKIWLLRRALAQGSWDGAVSIKMRRAVNTSLTQFVATNLRVEDVSAQRRRWSNQRRAPYRTIVVGSDQVWRPAYTDVRANFLLDETDDRARRVAYAASFGTDSLAEYGEALREQIRPFLARFDMVSVREGSGVDLCRQLGADAEVHVDPTLLLDTQHYRAIAVSNDRVHSGIQAMLLDSDEAKEREIDELGVDLGLDIAHFYPPELRSRREFRRNFGHYKAPTVESWLDAIATSSLVVTDSYHVCVFSIIFNVPFLAVGNAARGQARFTSLLKMFGLEARLVQSASNHGHPSVLTEDWQSVNQRRADERLRALAFLREAVAE